jgi:hypothetical protein
MSGIFLTTISFLKLITKQLQLVRPWLRLLLGKGIDRLAAVPLGSWFIKKFARLAVCFQNS